MEKINIAELLKDCPKGMELDCTMYDNVCFVEVTSNANYPIVIETKNGFSTGLTKDGQNAAIDDAKCVIFPKGETTWEGFVPPRKFKDGDILATDLGSVFALNTRLNTGECYGCYVGTGGGPFHICEPFVYKGCCRLATEEEKEKLFQAIKDNGYKWNAETKTLEKLIEPKFKVGDTIQDVDGYKVEIFKVDIDEECYEYLSIIAKGIGSIPFKLQDEWELVPNKFDITTLKPFDKVLVRDNKGAEWIGGILSHANYEDTFPFKFTDCAYKYCIPYNDDTKHLVGTTDECDEFYKTWEV